LGAALGLVSVSGVAGYFLTRRSKKSNNSRGANSMRDSGILDIQPLGFQWQTADPFLFCVHHHDFYPRGNAVMGPEASLAGRNIGEDFTVKEGWRMYHGQKIPGFPNHPHRGFETVTVVRKGFVDHSDSLGAAGRYGAGDVQWMTAGAGVQHAEMFPLISDKAENTLELFQIWLNLPKANKFVSPHFKMLWQQDIPRTKFTGTNGAVTEVEIIAGQLGDKAAPAPPPDSWAADPKNGVAIWIIDMNPDAEWLLPAATTAANRYLYYYEGENLQAEGFEVAASQGMRLDSTRALRLVNGKKTSRLLLLQGRPIAEPVAQYGPFVMNSRADIEQAFADYQRTHFGGWPWPTPEPVHPRGKGRFARHADGREENMQG
jgi:quercetin 2,3-dioxygenase